MDKWIGNPKFVRKNNISSETLSRNRALWAYKLIVLKEYLNTLKYTHAHTPYPTKNYLSIHEWNCSWLQPYYFCDLLNFME